MLDVEDRVTIKRLTWIDLQKLEFLDLKNLLIDQIIYCSEKKRKKHDRIISSVFIYISNLDYNKKFSIENFCDMSELKNDIFLKFNVHFNKTSIDKNLWIKVKGSDVVKILKESNSKEDLNEKTEFLIMNNVSKTAISYSKTCFNESKFYNRIGLSMRCD